MTPFNLLVFDFDGTLVDTKQDIADSVNRVLQELELRTLDRETLHTFIGKGVNHLMTRLLEGTGFDDLPRAIELLRRHGCLEDSVERARHYGAIARDAMGIFAEGKETLLVAMNPARLGDFFPEPDLQNAFLHWESDLRSIFDDLGAAN